MHRRVQADPSAEDAPNPYFRARCIVRTRRASKMQMLPIHTSARDASCEYQAYRYRESLPIHTSARDASPMDGIQLSLFGSQSILPREMHRALLYHFTMPGVSQSILPREMHQQCGVNEYGNHCSQSILPREMHLGIVVIITMVDDSQSILPREMHQRCS